MTIHHDPYLNDDGVAVVPSHLGNVSREALEDAVRTFAARIGELREAMHQMAGFVHDLRKPAKVAKSTSAAPDSLPSPETRSPSGRMCGSREHQAPLSPALIDVVRERWKQRAKWGAQHDQQHANGELLHAAMTLIASILGIDSVDDWGLAAKHDNERDRCVIAAALVVAQIERMDTEEAKP